MMRVVGDSIAARQTSASSTSTVVTSRTIRPRPAAISPGSNEEGAGITRIGSAGMTDTATPPPEEPGPDPASTMLSRQFLGLLVLAALIRAVAAAGRLGVLELSAPTGTRRGSQPPNALG